jgi:phosphoenolpyruvate synthase/pyruvate phosphate dikinase
MKLIKYITRNYSLRDHVLVVQALYKKNTSIKEIYYNEVVDINNKGLMDIYISPIDLQANIKRLEKTIKKDPGYLKNKIKEGNVAIKNLLNLPIEVLKNSNNLTNQEIIKITKLIKEKLFNFSGFFEFTHYLGRINFKLTDKQISELGTFHNKRKEAFVNSFLFLDKLYESSLQSKKSTIKNKKLNYLTTEEIIDYLKNNIAEKEINRKQLQRMKKYICIYKNNTEEIKTTNINNLIKKLIDPIKPKAQTEVRGQAINNGRVKGAVKIVTQNTPHSEIPKNSIIITQMSTPEMTPVLKRAKAIITDEGGLLCHAAIFAREFKIISLLGTKTATKIFKDGDIIEIDSFSKTAKKIS